MPKVKERNIVDHIKADREFMDGMRKGVKACKEGRVRLWSEIKKESGLH